MSMLSLRASMRFAVVVALAAATVSLGPATATDASCTGFLRLNCQTAASSNQSSELPAGDSQRYGFSDNTLWNEQFPRNVYLSKLQKSGATLLRSGINWQFYERYYKQYDEQAWGPYDRNYRDLLNAGVSEVITLIGTPYWALTQEGR